ncbi:GNAT family N-acetyltransferase [Enterococcus sp. AZ192]|uniref:GNAT family N-acetyltransferase n=1 Tax=unclassified Enterococcus TaxID=2608891 RepID=UPI003D2E63DA
MTKHNTEIKIVKTNSEDEHFLYLCRLLDEDLDHQSYNEKDKEAYSLFNEPLKNQLVFIAYDQEHPIGCASLKRFDQDHAEVKRVFVKNEYRSKKISWQLIDILADEAKKQGFQRLILETDIYFFGAIKFYEKYGFTRIPNFPPYEEMETSICMEYEL